MSVGRQTNDNFSVDLSLQTRLCSEINGAVEHAVIESLIFFF